METSALKTPLDDKNRQPHHHRGRKIAGGVAVAFIVLIVLAALFGGTWLRGFINDKGSSKLGREFAIDGPLTLHWHHGLVIHAEKIRMANEQGLAEKNMLEVGGLDIVLNPWKLLELQLNLPQLTIRDAHIILEKRTADDANWKLPITSQSKAVSDAALPQSRHSMPVIGELSIRNSTLEYRDDLKKMDIKLDLDTGGGTSGGASGKTGLDIKGHGTLQDKTFILHATGGAIDMLRDSNKPYPLDLSLTMGATKITVNGTFTDPVKLTGVDTHLHLEGDNLADLFYLTAIPLPPSPSYSIDGQLVKKTGAWAFNDFKGTVGHSDLGGNLTYDTTGKRGAVGATLVSKKLDFADLKGFAGATPKASEAGSAKQKANAERQAASPLLIPDVPIKLNRLRATDMDVSLKAKQILAPGWPLQDMDAHLVLKDGLLTINPLRFGVADGDVTGKVILDGRADTPKISTDITARQLSLKRFLTSPKLASMSAGTFGGHIAVSGEGDSLARIAGDSNGRVTMLMAGGKMPLLFVKAGGLDLASVGTLLATGDKDTTPIRCGVMDFSDKNGIMRSDILVFDTGDTSFTGGATINLKNQTMDIGIEASPKNPTLFAVDTPIKVTGLMKKPSVGIDPKEAGARITAAAVLGTFLTPIAAIIPFIEAGLGKDSDCRGLITEARTHDAAHSVRPHETPSALRTGEAPVTTAPAR